MRQVFVDTAALVALGNKQEDWHNQAVAVSRQIALAGCRFVIMDAVLLKVGNTFSRAAAMIVIPATANNRTYPQI